jgi:hypothetical protein
MDENPYESPQATIGASPQHAAPENPQCYVCRGRFSADKGSTIIARNIIYDVTIGSRFVCDQCWRRGRRIFWMFLIVSAVAAVVGWILVL